MRNKIKEGSKKLSKFIHRSSLKKVGQRPGMLIHVGEQKVQEVDINVIDYNEHKLEKHNDINVEGSFAFKDTTTTSWINVNGLHKVEIIEKIGNAYQLHPLVLEDILNTNQRPKIDDYGDYIFIVVKMLYHDEATSELQVEQISLVLGKNFVLSFQERKGDVFDPVRERLKNEKGLLRRGKGDYLTYALIDAIVDHYFIVLEKIGDMMEYLEADLSDNPSQKLLNRIRFFKKEIIFLRKSVWPLREVISVIIRYDGNPLIEKKVMTYYRDIYDHTIQVVDTIETYRDLISGMTDMYLSMVSNKMNEVMKVLTVFATIFIPLTFIAGVYGMNFEYMPELHWPYGYLYVWLVMLGIIIGMLFYFSRKKWL